MAGSRPSSSKRELGTPPLTNGKEHSGNGNTTPERVAKQDSESIDDDERIPVQLEDAPKDEPDRNDPMDEYRSRSGSTDPKQEFSSLKLEDSRPSATPPVSSRTKSKNEPQLIGHLPRAEEDALKAFIQIPENRYQYGTLGRSREAYESMTCDCQYEHGVDDADVACGSHSDCINRLTQVECLPEDCRCRSYCQNQRFQHKQYAPIDIVQTDKKGFGLRAAADLEKDTFIYEYLGDVVSQPSFLKRMRQYAEEGIRHFYFMMLQKDEFIDATKRGGIGRFANHSCNPNCYVAKWTIGQHVRMGIFANRNIKKDEELTFNYNVDRYGHDAQPCYCGEPNCVGFIGGKTQTDIAAMDDLYLDALGISEDVANLGLKGSKRRKSKKLDEDFIPILKPLVEKDVPKVVQALRQTQSRKVLVKLLMRIKLTEDLPALRQLMRLRGFSLMTNILEDYSSDLEVSTLAIECMMTWPLIQRNKVEDSKVNVPVQACAESENETLTELAKKLLAQWETLEYAYRIPKRLKAEGEDEASPVPPIDVPQPEEKSRPPKRQRVEFEIEEVKLAIQPLGFTGGSRAHFDIPPPPTRPDLEVERVRRENARKAAKAAQAAIIAKAAAEAEAAKLAAETALAEAEAKAKAAEERAARRKAAAQAGASSSSSRHKKQSKEEKETNKEKRLLKLVGVVVVKCMSKHQKQMSHDDFKKHAKELTHIIAEKEKKSSSYKEGKLDALSDEKVTKIKKFAKEYIAKVLRKLEKRRHSSSGSGKPAMSLSLSSISASASASTSISTSNSAAPGDDADADQGEIDMDSFMREFTGDIDQDDGDSAFDDDGDGDGDTNRTRDEDHAMAEGDADEGDSFDPHESPPNPVTPQSEVGPLVVAPIAVTTVTTTDPRLRLRSANDECHHEWDPDPDPRTGKVAAPTVVVSSVFTSR